MRGACVDGNLIRQIRTSMGWTQESLAMMAQCDIKTARKAEQSERLDLLTIKRIAQALKIDYSELLRDLLDSDSLTAN